MDIEESKGCGSRFAGPDRAAARRPAKQNPKQKKENFLYGRNEAWVDAAPPKRLQPVAGWSRSEILGGGFLLFERVIDYPTAPAEEASGVEFDRTHAFEGSGPGMITFLPAEAEGETPSGAPAALGTLPESSPNAGSRADAISAAQAHAGANMVSPPMGGPYDTDTSSVGVPAPLAPPREGAAWRALPKLPPVAPGLPGLGQAMVLAEPRCSLTVSLDTEYLGADGPNGTGRRKICSWQACFTVGTRLVEWVILPLGDAVLDIDVFCGLVAARAGAPPRECYSRWPKDKRDKAPFFDMTLIAHSTQADVTTFIGSKQLLQTLCSAAGGLFTGRKTWDAVVPCKKVLDGAGNSQFYHLRVRVRDTMNFSAGGTPLAALGDAVGLRKLEMSEDDYRHMDRVRDDETQRFIDYAIRDAEICHRYMAVAFGLLNIRYKPTIPSLSATYLRSCCEMVLSAMGYEGVGEGSCRTSAYDYHFRGLRRENKGLVPLNESQNFVMDSRLEPATEYARDCQDLARRAFKGGWNGCNVAGYFDLVTYDPDLCGAYPTASGAMLDPDYQQPFVATWEDRDMMLQQLPPWSAFRPGFGCVHFEFPDEVKYPCLGYQTDHGIVFPQTSEGTSGCYVTLPEVVLALRLGARVHAIRFVIPAVHQRDGILLAAYKGLIEQREHDAALYGKKSVQALGDKLMNNAGYGKHGQDVSPKEVRSLATLKMEDRGTSEITNAVVASMSTALPRICLLAAANQLAGLGYNVYSVTTDGFIMDAPFDVLTSLDLYGFADRMRYVRSYYTDGRSDAVWEIKHEQKRLLNQTTRLNIGFAPGGVLARGGYKGYKPEPGEHDVSAEAREQFAHDIVTRKGPLGYISRDWVSPVEMLQKDIDMRVCDGRHAANPNFDMKRMPDLDTMRDVEFECAGDIVRVATYDTRPYRTLADFRRHKTTVGGHQLVVREDYVAAATRAANYTGRDLADTDYVRWAVVAHRSGRIT